MGSVACTRVSAVIMLVLWASVQGSAVPEGSAAPEGSTAPEGGSSSQQASLIGTLDQLWTFIDRVEKTATESVLTQVDTRLEDVHTRLSAQVSDLASQLVDTNQLNVQLSAQVSELYSRRDDCSQLNTRLSDQLKELSSRLDLVEAEASPSPGSSKPLPRDCSDLPTGGQSGVYLLQPGLGGTVPVPAYCDLDTDGGRWTVIQRRADVTPREDFYLGWVSYKEGFGELDVEFWWGLANMWAMTSPRDRQYELRIDLEDFEGGKRHAIYQTFRISSESDGYRLAVTNYTGNANDGLAHHIGSRFSTKDRDYDSVSNSCAQSYKGAWWYNECHDSNLNGQYLAGPHASHANGVNWEFWRGNKYSLKTATMKIRPTRKSLNE